MEIAMNFHSELKQDQTDLGAQIENVGLAFHSGKNSGPQGM